MPEQPPDKLDDTQDLTGTQPLDLPEWTPPPTSGRARPPRASTLAPRSERGVAQAQSARSQRAARWYLPAWSVGLMLLLVFGITGAIVMLVVHAGRADASGRASRAS